MQEQTVYIILSWVYTTLTLCLVLNRVYVRKLHSFALHWSDIMVGVAWSFNFFQSICDMIMYLGGAMVSMTSLNLEVTSNHRKAVLFKKIYYVESIIYYFSLYLVKAAILLFMLEVTPHAVRSLRFAMWAGLGFVIMALAYTVCAFAFACWPIEKWWSLGGGQDFLCHTRGAFFAVALWLHVASDVYVYTLPFFLIRRLPLTRRQTIAGWAMFGACWLLVCLSIPQIVGIWLPLLEDPFTLKFWVRLHEQNLAITVACLGSLRVTLHRVHSCLSEDLDLALRSGRSSRKNSRGNAAMAAISDAETQEGFQLSPGDLEAQFAAAAVRLVYLENIRRGI